MTEVGMMDSPVMGAEVVMIRGRSQSKRIASPGQESLRRTRVG